MPLSVNAGCQSQSVLRGFSLYSVCICCVQTLGYIHVFEASRFQGLIHTSLVVCDITLS
jgi:hypothetical protein